jgi:hypothetical protein
MPLTPFHLGPGSLFKAIGGDRFSFVVFGGSQVLIDGEPLVRMLRGDNVLHGLSHTILGASAIAVVAALLGRPIGELFLHRMRIEHRPLTWRVSFFSAFIGTYSHIALDADMHRDMQPLWPFAIGNPFLGIISVSTLYLICVCAGILGAWMIFSRIGEKSS